MKNKNNITRKVLEVLLYIIVCVSFVLMGATRPDGSVFLPWNLGWLAALCIAARALDRMGAFDKYSD